MSHRQGLHSDDSPYPGEPLCYCDEKTPTTSTPTDLDKLKDDIAVEVSIVFKHAKLGTDYTINCTNTIASMAENYARALIQAEIVKALETLLLQAREHTITDIEMIMHQTNGKVDFIEAVTTDQIIKYITALKEEI